MRTGHRRLLLVVFLLMSCRSWSPAPLAALPPPVAGVQATEAPTNVNVAAPSPVPSPVPSATVEVSAAPLPVWHGEPAGCLADNVPVGTATTGAMLAYADRLIRLERTLTERVSTAAWNAVTGAYDYQQNRPVTIDIDGVQNEYLIQRMMNALHAAGFVTWLRESDRPEQGLHILAIPLLDTAILSGKWAVYLQSYWQDASSVPPGDPFVKPTLKLPPCRWMIERGFAPETNPGWWTEGSDRWPDFARVSQQYLAADTDASTEVARRIDWNAHLEAANTMCGPLTWSILQNANAFPPGMGAWMEGPQTFWLAKPTENGRPWNLFPTGTYRVYHFGTALSRFDFTTFPLYTGDVLYLYSEKDGFDHILIVTETYPDGSVYTVTNLTREHPEPSITIERRVLLHTIDKTAGLARNEWEDRSNGRTGHAGFDVFRWDWMEKDINNTPVRFTVMAGDTLDFLAVRWKTPAEKIARYNGMDINTPLAVGQEILIPPNQWEAAP